MSSDARGTGRTTRAVVSMKARILLGERCVYVTATASEAKQIIRNHFVGWDVMRSTWHLSVGVPLEGVVISLQEFIRVFGSGRLGWRCFIDHYTWDYAQDALVDIDYKEIITTVYRTEQGLA